MITIDRNNNPHNFEKQNLVTTVGGFDVLKCSECGIFGKTTSLSTLAVKGSYSKDKVNNCTKDIIAEEKKKVNRKIKITYCTAQGKAFKNLTPESVHEVIKTPDSETVDLKGVWVNGVGEPVKVLNDEFNYL